MSNEAIRIPVWATTLIVSIIIPALIGGLGTDPDWKLIAIQSLVTMSILLGGGEVARKRSYSEETVVDISTNANEAGYMDGYMNALIDQDGGI